KRGQVDGNGNIYILADKPPFIRKYTDGKLIKWWGYNGEVDGRIQDPVDLTLDRDGNIYVADEGREGPGRIQKFTPEGKLIWRLDGIPE
ncbi:MAG: hypothetical protein Q8N68_02070, partial [bacterium]|nr:hypothetical protein [bacterium]